MAGSFSEGISSSSFHGSILNRVPSRDRHTSFSEAQSLVDHLVGNATAAVSDERMTASLFGAGLAGRFIRVGCFAPGRSLTFLVKGLSRSAGLAGESAVFAGLERTFTEGHGPVKPFQMDWARAAFSLGVLKIFGAATRGQNLVLQHLAMDAALVAGPPIGHCFGVMDKPQGTLAERMIQAEGMTLG